MGEGRAPLHFWETGEGPPLVLVHGGLSNGLLAWSRTAEALSAYHRLIVVDRRGHGKSPRLPRPYTIASDARDLVQLAAALGLERLHLAGHSYGALVAYEMAVRTPQAVASLHLIEPPMLTIAADVPEVQALIRRSLDLWREAGRLRSEELAARFLAMVAGEAFVQEVRTRPVWSELVAEAGRLPYEENPAAYMPPAFTAANFRFPVRVYRGGRSHPALRIVAERLAHWIPGARLIHVPEAYHEVHKSGAPFEEALLHVTRG